MNNSKTFYSKRNSSFNADSSIKIISYINLSFASFFKKVDDTVILCILNSMNSNIPFKVCLTQHLYSDGIGYLKDCECSVWKIIGYK